MDKYTEPTNPEYEKAKGRIALWLAPQDLVWLASHCSCGAEATPEEKERCLRIRFRAGAALHKAGFSLTPEVPPEEVEKALSQDAQLARERGLTFEVVQKAARGAKWETVTETEDLRDALTQARAIDNYEMGVFARFPDGLGFVYWTSRHPDVLNSTVISMEYTT